MTEWRSPGDEPGEARVEPGREPTDASARRPRNRRQVQLQILAGVLGAATVVLLLVVLLTGGDDGPAKGSPEAAVDRFATALRSGTSGDVGALSCGSARTAVLAGVHHLLGTVTSAHRAGAATSSSASAVARLLLTAGGKNDVATLALRQDAGTWCVAGFVTSAAP